MSLQHQLNCYMKSEERLAKLKAMKLHTYWKKICKNEEASRLRTERFMEEFDRIDKHTQILTQQSERLNHQKTQSMVDYERKYPDWKGFTQTQSPTNDMLDAYDQDGTNQQIICHIPQMEEEMIAHGSVMATNDNEPQYQNLPGIAAVVGGAAQTARTDYIDGCEGVAHQSEMESLVKKSGHNETLPSSDIMEASKTDQNHYNFAMAMPKSVEQQDSLSESPTETLCEDDSKKCNDTTKDLTVENAPLLHVTEEFHPKVKDIANYGECGDGVCINSSMTEDHMENVIGHQLRVMNMHDVSDEDQEDSDEPDDFHESREACISEEAISTAVETHSYHEEKNDSIEVFPPPTKPDGISLQPELSISGLVHLFAYIDDEMDKGTSETTYYQSNPPGPALRSQIIQKANNSCKMENMNVGYVTMVALEQLTHICRSLPKGSMLPDLLIHQNENLTPAAIGKELPDEGLMLWDSLIKHFFHLIERDVMSVSEIAAVFTPCLIEQNSPYQNNVYSLLVKILSKLDSDSDSDSEPPPLPKTPVPSLQANTSSHDAYKNMMTNQLNKVRTIDFVDDIDDDYAESHLYSMLPERTQASSTNLSLYSKFLETSSTQNTPAVQKDDIDFDFYE